MYNVIHDILNEIRITNNINFVKANDNVTYPTNIKINNICIHLKPTDTNSHGAIQSVISGRV